MTNIRLEEISNKYGVEITTEETHQWDASDLHLPTRLRRTYVSSEWYRVRDFEGNVNFRTRIINGDSEGALKRAIDRLEKEMPRWEEEEVEEEYPDYFTREQHLFMIAAQETLEDCGWDEEDAFQEAQLVLDDWDEAHEKESLPTEKASIRKVCEIFVLNRLRGASNPRATPATERYNDKTKC